MKCIFIRNNYTTIIPADGYKEMISKINHSFQQTSFNKQITLPNNRTFGMYWGIGGFLLPAFLGKVKPEKVMELQARVANEIKTTFASHYTKEVSLEEALQLESLMVYAKQATGEKFLIKPNG